MYNVFLIGQCNLSCGYCFAEEWIDHHPKRKPISQGKVRKISLPDFEQVLAFLLNSQVSVVSLIGGEPTLHPDFSTLVKLALEMGFTVSVKSNATWSEKVMGEVDCLPVESLHFLLNVNPPSFLGPKLWQRVVRNVDRLNGRPVDFQFNVDGGDFEAAYLFDLAESCGSNKIVWSLSSMVKGEVLSNPGEIRARYSKRLLSFVLEAAQRGFRTVGVHGVTPCMFSEPDYRTILAHGGRLEATCQPVFDILPDLEVLFCFPMKRYFGEKYLYHYRDLQALNMEFLETLAFMRSDLFPLPECVECPYLLSQECHGGCIAQHLKDYAGPEIIDQRFYEYIPRVNPKFWIEPASDHRNKASLDEALLKDISTGSIYPIDKNFSQFLQAMDGRHSFGELYRTFFNRGGPKETTGTSYKELVTQLLKREVIFLEPYHKIAPERSS